MPRILRIVAGGQRMSHRRARMHDLESAAEHQCQFFRCVGRYNAASFDLARNRINTHGNIIMDLGTSRRGVRGLPMT